MPSGFMYPIIILAARLLTWADKMRFVLDCLNEFIVVLLERVES